MKDPLKYLDELEALCAKATPGPWIVDGAVKDDKEESFAIGVLNEDPQLGNGQLIHSPTHKVLESWDYEGYSSGFYILGPNADFIAASREAVPRLTKALRVAISELKALYDEEPNALDENEKRIDPYYAIDEIAAILSGEGEGGP